MSKNAFTPNEVSLVVEKIKKDLNKGQHLSKEDLV